MKHDTNLKKLLPDYYCKLVEHFGPRNWWPAETPFEVCIGAVLTQNTAWKNVEKAIDNLKTASLLDPLRLHKTTYEDLAQIIRPAGYYNVKAKRVRNFVDLLVQKYQADILLLFSLSKEELREELLSVSGIGKETADSIILYAAQKPIFVVDAYTKRVLWRHNLVEEHADYDTIQDLFHDNLPHDMGLFNDFHAQIVAVGHHYCKKKPLCGNCPLARFPTGTDRAAANDSG
jgi:endonuclease-3 related protein